MVNLNIKSLIIIFSFTLFGNLTALPTLNEIPQSKIDSSLVHSAVQLAHDTGELTTLTLILDIMPESIESLTQQQEIVDYVIGEHYDRRAL